MGQGPRGGPRGSAGAGGTEILRLRPIRDYKLQQRCAAIERQVRALTGDTGFVYQANLDSLNWLMKRGQKNLMNSIIANHRPQFKTQTGGKVRLEDAVINPAYHSVTASNIRIFSNPRIERDAPQYHSLEVGNNYWPQSGRLLPFLFLGARKGSNSPNFRSDPKAIFNRSRSPANRRSNFSKVVAGSSTRVSDRLVGKREYDRRYGTTKAFKSQQVYVRIRRPVPAFHYMGKARDTFNQQGMYKRFVNKRAKAFEQATGITLDGAAAKV